MARNVEIKARIGVDQPGRLRQLASEIATDGPIWLEQTDTFFRSRRGRLKLREFDGDTAEIIFYERPDCEGPKTSSYIRSQCLSPEPMKAALAESNGILGVVKKQREVFFVGQTRIHLDQVEGLGAFLELEVVLNDGDSEEQGERLARELMGRLEIADSQLVSGAYFDLLTAESV